MSDTARTHATATWWSCFPAPGVPNPGPCGTRWWEGMSISAACAASGHVVGYTGEDWDDLFRLDGDLTRAGGAQGCRVPGPVRNSAPGGRPLCRRRQRWTNRRTPKTPVTCSRKATRGASHAVQHLQQGTGRLQPGPVALVRMADISGLGRPGGCIVHPRRHLVPGFDCSSRVPSRRRGGGNLGAVLGTAADGFLSSLAQACKAAARAAERYARRRSEHCRNRRMRQAIQGPWPAQRAPRHHLLPRLPQAP